MLCLFNDKNLNSDTNLHLGAGRVSDLRGLTSYTVDPDAEDFCVQADGHELLAIKQQFTNIPMHNGRCVRWTGNTAKFIFDNLKL